MGNRVMQKVRSVEAREGYRLWIEFGAIFWPNGADLAPDAVYLQLKGPVQTPQ